MDCTCYRHDPIGSPYDQRIVIIIVCGFGMMALITDSVEVEVFNTGSVSTATHLPQRGEEVQVLPHRPEIHDLCRRTNTQPRKRINTGTHSTNAAAGLPTRKHAANQGFFLENINDGQ